MGDPGKQLSSDQENMRKLIWVFRHLQIVKVNAIPPADRDAVFNIDVGDANLIAQRLRPVAPTFLENLDDLIKGLLTAQIIRSSTSPWE